MNRSFLSAAAATLLLAACGSPESDAPQDEPPETPVVSGSASPAGEASPTAPPPLAAELTRAEWSRAENREDCAPLALTGDGGRPATARRAEFAGGWGVAFDTPEIRSAYGIAGPGLVAADRASPAEQSERLLGQWPHFTTLPDLPAPAFAGYGVEGAAAYPPDNPQGRGLNSLAYVRVGGEQCTYNVWSRLGRAHLETLLASLRRL